jgi:hypothetical protein
MKARGGREGVDCLRVAAARRRREMCSTKAPWRARTPIVRVGFVDGGAAVLLGEGCMMLLVCSFVDPGVMIGSACLVLSCLVLGLLYDDRIGTIIVQ